MSQWKQNENNIYDSGKKTTYEWRVGEDQWQAYRTFVNMFILSYVTYKMVTVWLGLGEDHSLG